MTGTILDVTVGAGEQVILSDVVGQLGFTGSGALRITSGQTLRVGSRTYNKVADTATCTPGGAFGQWLGAFSTGQGLAAGEAAWLTQLTENADYRTNIALTNTGTSETQVTVTLYDGAGAELDSYDVTLDPGEWKQANRPFFTLADQSNMARGYAKVEVISGTGILASASVVNNSTNDPTTMEMMPVVRGGMTDAWMVGSHANGAMGSKWRTDTGAMNAQTTDANVTVTLHAAGTTYTDTTQIVAGSQAILVDVVGQLEYTGSGALQITSDQPLFVSSRIYNQIASTAECTPNGAFGQLYPAHQTEDGLSSGDTAWLTQLTENTDYRTNISLTNSGTTQAQVTVTLYDGSGTELASYDVWLTPGEWKQANQPFFNHAGQTDLDAGYAKVEVVDGVGIIASASVVNNSTDDPTTIPMMR